MNRMNVTNAAQYQYDVLDNSDEALILDVAECLAQTFAGVQIGSTIVSEPMTVACEVATDVHQEFSLGYLQEVVEQGYCFIAKDPASGKVVGVVACDIYDPNMKPPVFEGDLAPMNHIIRFLDDLDVGFKDVVKRKTGADIQQNQYLHVFMVGVRTTTNRKQIGLELLEIAVKKAQAAGMKGVFAEATNFKCQKLFEMVDFYVPLDRNNDELSKFYSEDEVFRSIPENIAVDCKLVYRPCGPDFELR